MMRQSEFIADALVLLCQKPRCLKLCPRPIAREDGRERPYAGRGRRRATNDLGWVRGFSLTPHPILYLEGPGSPLPQEPALGLAEGKTRGGEGTTTTAHTPGLHCHFIAARNFLTQ